MARSDTWRRRPPPCRRSLKLHAPAAPQVLNVVCSGPPRTATTRRSSWQTCASLCVVYRGLQGELQKWVPAAMKYGPSGAAGGGGDLWVASSSGVQNSSLVAGRRLHRSASSASRWGTEVPEDSDAAAMPRRVRAATWSCCSAAPHPPPSPTMSTNCQHHDSRPRRLSSKESQKHRCKVLSILVGEVPLSH